MKIKSYAKINFFLKVKKKDLNENLHKIYSFFHLEKRIFDEITIEESENEAIYYFSNEKIENCIIERTLFFLRSFFNIQKKYKIIISKKIPIGSGLGGASSNAAEVIRFILKNEEIKNWNFSFFLPLGSDVPFFLSKYENAVVSGYGGLVEKQENISFDYKVKINKINCSTKKIYNKFSEDSNNLNDKKIKNQLKYLYNYSFDLLENDLKESCFALYPDLVKKYRKFSLKNYVLLSGSGSSMILIKRYKNEKQHC